MKSSYRIVEEISNGSIRKQKDELELLNVIDQWPELVEYTGLSGYEAKVYLCLVGLGISSARKLSRFSDVPRTKVYSTLNRLADAGLVIEVPLSPKLFIPVPPDEAFSAMFKLMKKKIISFASVMQRLAETQENVKRKVGPQKKTIWYFSGDRDITKKIKDIIENTRHRLIIITNEEGVSMLFNFDHILIDKLPELGIDVKIYSPLERKTSTLVRELSYLFHVEEVEVDAPVFIVVSDQKRLLYAKINTHSNNSHFEYAIFTDDPSLLFMLSLMRVGCEGKNLPDYTNLIPEN